MVKLDKMVHKDKIIIIIIIISSFICLVIRNTEEDEQDKHDAISNIVITLHPIIH